MVVTAFCVDRRRLFDLEKNLDHVVDLRRCSACQCFSWDVRLPTIGHGLCTSLHINVLLSVLPGSSFAAGPSWQKHSSRIKSTTAAKPPAALPY